MKTQKKIKTRDLKSQIITLLERYHLVSASDLLTHLAKEHREYNKTSVYRCLDTLVAEDEICKHYFDNGQAVFELREHHHAHLYCKKCGDVQQVDCQVEKISKLNGFVADHHHLTYIGMCATCSQKT